jgi:DNA-binding response OmpR family regulator
MLEEFKPEAILLDIFLEGLDGRDVCKFLKQNTALKQTKVIGMSGVYSLEIVMEEEGGGGGFDAFLKKPFKFSELKEKIHELQSDETKPGAFCYSGSGESAGGTVKGVGQVLEPGCRPRTGKRKLKARKEAVRVGD